MHGWMDGWTIPLIYHHQHSGRNTDIYRPVYALATFVPVYALGTFVVPVELLSISARERRKVLEQVTVVRRNQARIGFLQVSDTSTHCVHLTPCRVVPRFSEGLATQKVMLHPAAVCHYHH